MEVEFSKNDILTYVTETEEFICHVRELKWDPVAEEVNYRISAPGAKKFGFFWVTGRQLKESKLFKDEN